MSNHVEDANIITKWILNNKKQKKEYQKSGYDDWSSWPLAD